jgi:hypothetical protein
MLVAVAAVSAEGADNPWLTANHYDSVRIVVAAEAPETYRTAAHDLASYWERVTGHPALVSSEAGDGVAFWIGEEVFPDAVKAHLNANRPGESGVYLRTVDQGGVTGLALAGGPGDGTVNAVYVFIEKYLGVRWVAPDLTHIPEAPPSIPVIDYQYTPPFRYRWTGNWRGADRAQESAFERVHRLRVPDIGSNGHNLYELVPPDKHFEAHPDYYSMLDCKRIAPTGEDWRTPEYRANSGNAYAQLCMTHPEVPERIMETLREWIAARPDTPIWGVMQEDNFGFCECPECAAVDAAEDSRAGALLTGINRVAERYAAEFPDKEIITYAYLWSRKPPKTLHPAPNVIMQLCSIECDASRPMNDANSMENAAFSRELIGWGAISDQLFMYDYVPNYRAWFRPHPNLHVIQPNLAYYAENGVTGVFMSGCTEEKGEFTVLRTYLIAKALWDPYMDGQAVIDEFLALYYEDAAPHIRRYIDAVCHAAADNNAVVTCYDPGWWIDTRLVREGRAILADARAAANSDAVRERVHLLELSMDYAAMKAAPDATIKDGTIILERPPAPSIDEMLAALEAAGVKEVDEETWHHGDMSRHFNATYERPRRQESDLVVLENDAYLVWVAPALQGSVLRWQHKASGAELLQGYQHYGTGPGTFEEWVSTPGVPEGPPADTYEVIEQSAHAVVLRAVTPSGLEITRTMRLPAGSGPLTVDVVLTNPTTAPLPGNLKLHPEFSSLGLDVPEIWFGADGKWTHMNDGLIAGELSHGSFSHGEYLPAGNFDAMAYHVPQADLSVICNVDADQAGGLLWYFDVSRSAQQVNLEIIAPSEPLPPGAQRRLTASYAVRKGDLRE